MNMLLDTHALVWALHAPQKLADPARAAIEDGANAVYYSAASVWELAIKSGKGLIELDVRFLEAAAEAPFTELPLRGSHAWAVRSLPPIHSDPFDRILAAQDRCYVHD